ncbi:MAG TPA: hypothetical protein VGO50_04160 [Pyrinomonadaceae bacterium]|jgi:hypothetical protein|nr:hypothetical protein [Pyrinomonadaceae bacterium]
MPCHTVCRNFSPWASFGASCPKISVRSWTFLRQIVLDDLPPYCVERLSYNVPYYYGKRRICMIWPAAVPRGGIKTGVLLGFSQGHRLADVDRYLTHGTNTVVFYKIVSS